jgi:ABC-type oligopeptide transport system ATPase subunit
MSEILFEVKNLKKYFPVHAGVFRRQIGNVKAVDGIDFAIRKEGVLGMVGESGSGKSTAARAAIRLIEPTEGEISFLNSDLRALSLNQLRHVRKDIQMVFQDPYASLNPRKTVADNIGEPLLYHKMVANDKERVDRVVEILGQIGLSTDVLNRYPHEFSGGQQQRVCIGRAIALRPKLIVFDEALSALDVSVQAQILNLLQELKKTFQLSYLFISHDLSVIRYLCDHVLVLYMGKVVEEAPVEQLFANPKHSYTQALLSAIPRDHPREKKRSRISSEPL